MRHRTSKDLCLLCQHNSSDQTGSHYTPNFLLQHVVGKRDYEEIHTFNTRNLTPEEYYGRSNLSNENATISEAHHKADFIFCGKCEKALGKIESECAPFLSSINSKLGSLKIARTKSQNKYISLSKINSNVLRLFFYSVIWRQIIQQELQVSTQWHNQEFKNLLRTILTNQLYSTLNRIKNSTDFEHYPNMIILTTYSSSIKEKGFFGPSTQASSWELFYLGFFIVLISNNKSASENSLLGNDFKKLILDTELSLNTSDKPKIVLINESPWSKIHASQTNSLSKMFFDRFIQRLIQSKGWTYNHSGAMLHEQAKKYENLYPKDYFRCLEFALQDLLE